MGRGQRWESLPSRGQWGRAAGRGLGAPAQERRDPHSAGQPLWAAGWAGALVLQEGLGWGLRLRQLTLLLLCWAGPSEWNPLRPLVCLRNAHPRPSSPQLWPFCSAEVGGVGCARVRLVPPARTNQSGGIWSAGPLFAERGLGGCGGPIPGPVLAQPSLQGPPRRTRAIPKQTGLNQAQPPRLPGLLSTSRWAQSQPPSVRLYPRPGPQGRVVDTRPLRDGVVGPRSPPRLCPLPPQVPG